MKTIISVLTILLFATGCSSSSDDSIGFQSPYTNEDYPPGTVINGYVLPPEPDHEENDRTLLGIDTNNNGMRDDVERYIIIKENEKPNKFPKTWTAVELQGERAMRYFWETGKIKKLREYDGCKNAIEKYLKEHVNIFVDFGKNRDYYAKSIDGVDKLTFNTKSRDRESVARAYDGEVFDGRYDKLSNCESNILSFGELP